MDGLLPKTFFAAVGTDGNFQTSSHGDVPGSLVVAGTGDVKIGTQGHVLGNAHLAGNLRPSTSYWISGDAFVAGDVRIGYDPALIQSGAACGVAPPAPVP